MRKPMEEYYALHDKLMEWREVGDIVNDAKTHNQPLNRTVAEFLHENLPQAKVTCSNLINECQYDLMKRVKRRKTMIILVLLWPILAIVGGIIARILAAESLKGMSWIILVSALYGVVILGDYSLCWVGFPVGWNKFRELGGYSNNPIIVLVSFFAGLFTMCFSYFIAIAQIFKEKKRFPYILAVINELKNCLSMFSEIHNYLYE